MKTIEEYLKEEGFKPNKYGAFIAKISGYDFNLEMLIRDYATEAIKADRERIKEHFDDCEYADHVIDGIDNLPIELK